MKICPFCREEIREDAVKCRYCGSSLLPGQPTAEKSDTGPSASADQVIYVVDQGLIRFAKFALAILALFVAVGAALYGFDIQKGVDKVREGVDKVRDSEDSIQKMRISLENQIREIQKTSEQIERSRQNVSDNEGKVQDLRNEAQSFVDWIERNKPAVLAFVARIPAAGVEITQAAIIPQSDRPWFTAPELAKLYDVPVDLNGDGQTIGFLELGGGFRESDLDSYFAALHVSKPNVEWVSVDGAKNQPQESNTGADGQVANDIEIAGAIAYGAKIRVYFAPNTDAGFVDVVRKAVADRVTILSISWGAPESVWSKKEIAALNSALESAAKQGITVLCATGDLGAADGVEDGKAHVDFPSSSPWVLAIGGTRLKASNGAISSEVVWNDGSNATGGGVSDLFSPPDWQSGLRVPTRADGQKGRGVPDLAANASPASGYYIMLHGEKTILGGTSAATPFWAGLVAILNQGSGRNLGYFNPTLYKSIGPTDALHKIAEGNNGILNVKGYAGSRDWNPAVGWGSPSGRRLLEAARSQF